MSEKNLPKISVIMSIYEPEEERLKHAVESIVKQEFQDWELLIYDDGSSQEGASLIQRMARMDGRIRYLRGTINLGLAYGLNLCIRYARGKYIARMDADDVANPERLSRQYVFLETHPWYHWAGSNAFLENQKGIFGILRVPRKPVGKDFLPHSPYIHPTVMFRKEILIKSGGYSAQKDVLLCEDYELFFRLHGQGYRGYNLQKPLLRYWEPVESYKRRRGRRRLREMKVRYQGYRRLVMSGLLPFLYLGKPLLAGLAPTGIYTYLRRNRYKNPWKERE